MANTDQPRLKQGIYSKSALPVLGTFIDYIDTSFEYLWHKTMTQAEAIYARRTRPSLSSSFLAVACMVLGLICNVKFEVVTKTGDPLMNDLHFLALSPDEHLYVDDVDGEHMLWCLESSDCLVLLISCFLIWNTTRVSSPLSEYLFVPWLGAALRGLFLRQVPTAVAMLYTVIIIKKKYILTPVLLTGFSLLFLIESRLWVEVVRMVRLRYEQREVPAVEVPLDVLHRGGGEAPSVEMRNHVY